MSALPWSMNEQCDAKAELAQATSQRGVLPTNRCLDKAGSYKDRS
jgi:hypothetical protein